MKGEMLMVFLAVGFVFFGLIIGAILGKAIYFLFYDRLEQLYTFCGGLLAGVLCFILLPQALTAYQPLGIFLGAAGGFVMMKLLDVVIHEKLEVRASFKQSALKPVVFLCIAISFHNIPAGMALGSSLVADSRVSVPLIVAVALHAIPEGMAIFLPMLMSDYNLAEFGGLAFVLSLFLGLGCWFGVQIGAAFFQFNTLLMGGAIGAIIYVTFLEVLLEAKARLQMDRFLVPCLSGMLAVFAYFWLVG